MSFRNQAGILEIDINGTIKRLPFFQGTNLIGRNPNKTNISIKDRSISEIHAKLICKDQTIKIVDNNSKNGVYLNSVENQLKAGDEVLIDCSKDVIFLSTFSCKIIPQWQEYKNREEQTMGIEQQTLPDNKFKQKKNDSLEKGTKIEKQTKKIQTMQSQQDKKDVIKTKQNTKQDKNKEESVKERQTKNKNEKSKEKQNSKETNRASKNKKKQAIIEVENEESDHLEHKNQKKIKEQKVSKEKDQISKGKKNSQEKKKKREKKKNSIEKKQEKESQNIEFEQNKKVGKDKKSTQKMNKNTKKNKRPSSEETLAKNKKKGRPKSLNKIESREPELQARKKMISSDQNPYFMRNLQQKSALLSNCTFAFVPSVRIRLIKEICQQFDVLVMDKFLRTFKLLCAILKGKPIVSSSWVLQSQFKRKVMPIERYFLEGPQKNLISSSVEKVREGNRVFQGLKFLLISEQYHLNTEQIEELIQLGGGQVLKPKQKPTKSTIVILANEYGHSDLVNAKNLPQCQKVYKIELILDSCLRQEIDWNSNQVPKL